MMTNSSEDIVLEQCDAMPAGGPVAVVGVGAQFEGSTVEIDPQVAEQALSAVRRFNINRDSLSVLEQALLGLPPVCDRIVQIANAALRLPSARSINLRQSIHLLGCIEISVLAKNFVTQVNRKSSGGAGADESMQAGELAADMAQAAQLEKPQNAYLAAAWMVSARTALVRGDDELLAQIQNQMQESGLAFSQCAKKILSGETTENFRSEMLAQDVPAEWVDASLVSASEEKFQTLSLEMKAAVAAKTVVESTMLDGPQAAQLQAETLKAVHRGLPGASGTLALAIQELVRVQGGPELPALIARVKELANASFVGVFRPTLGGILCEGSSESAGAGLLEAAFNGTNQNFLWVVRSTPGAQVFLEDIERAIEHRSAPEFFRQDPFEACAVYAGWIKSDAILVMSFSNGISSSQLTQIIPSARELLGAPCKT